MNVNAAERMRIVYFGTPAYAVPALDALLGDDRAQVALVVTQPDRPAGRGRKLTPPPVKTRALDRAIPVYQPDSLRTAEDRAPIEAAGADLFVVAAFGKIFGPKLLGLPRLGAVNLHASLLPLYRGASPISAAILEGRTETGITLMRMDTGLDTGTILAKRTLTIVADATTTSLTQELAQLGALLLTDSLDGLATRTISESPQDESAASSTRPLVKADGWIDWNHSAERIERLTRAMWEWPRAWTTLDGEPVQVHRASVNPLPASERPGTIVDSRGAALVATGTGYLAIDVAQSAGGKPTSGAQWLTHSGAIGKILGAHGAPALPSVPMIRRVAG